jgi:hypothetical protein
MRAHLQASARRGVFKRSLVKVFALLIVTVLLYFAGAMHSTHQSILKGRAVVIDIVAKKVALGIFINNQR